jgi:catalase (peroxidase I)
MRSLAERTGDGGIPEGGFTAVMEDLKALLTDSKDFWPADFADSVGANYGGLFIRLAWHCSGSFRESDGRGGCDGGRIRFDPEASWDDNINLDKARQLLEPIKAKYGESLSWGDLIILSGNAAMESMGFPLLGFCGGRIDDADGADSIKLGPSPEQEEIAPCLSVSRSMQGDCLSVEGSALGPTTMGLIYVNPNGPVGAFGDPVASGEDIREAFSRMGFNDTESVALIGGGHAFGKMHGPCVDPPCGDGLGANAWTSGFEGQWTTLPTTWTNQYFNNLFDYTWTNYTGPGGNVQWQPSTDDGSAAPDIVMLTTDIAMAMDDTYRPISEVYAADIAKLEHDFAHAWYRLTSADMGPATRCIGEFVPDPQPFQYTLPASPETLPDYVPVRTAVQALLDEDEANVDAFINLAYRCASTYRATDHKGGCNGARIRFAPESEWESNVGTNDTLATLKPVKDTFPDVSWADLIVLAGLTALENENSELELSFCGGSVDADNADGSEVLAPRVYSTPLITVEDDFQVKGLTPEEGVALASREAVGSQYYKDLIAAGGGNGGEFSDYELALLEDEFRVIVDNFAEDEGALLTTFQQAWTKMMTADRYLNYRENACTDVSTPTKAGEPMEPTDPPVKDESKGFGLAWPVLGVTFAVGLAFVL